MKPTCKLIIPLHILTRRLRCPVPHSLVQPPSLEHYPDTPSSANSTAPIIRFGIGPHSCPSRKFGLAVVKVVLAKLVLGYDLELESQGKSSRRPFAAVEYEGFNFPDEGGRVRMRRRRRR